MDHRVEAACPVVEPHLIEEIKDILNIQLKDNVKARLLKSTLDNEYVQTRGKKIRSQIEVYNYLYSMALKKAAKPV
jgi:polyphosphate kinase